MQHCLSRLVVALLALCGAAAGRLEPVEAAVAAKKLFSQVEGRWLEEARKALLSEKDAAAGLEHMRGACTKVATAVLSAGHGDVQHVTEYMGNVCGEGPSTDPLCVEFGQRLVKRMESNSTSDLAEFCEAFWHGPLVDEAARTSGLGKLIKHAASPSKAEEDGKIEHTEAAGKTRSKRDHKPVVKSHLKSHASTKPPLSVTTSAPSQKSSKPEPHLHYDPAHGLLHVVKAVDAEATSNQANSTKDGLLHSRKRVAWESDSKATEKVQQKRNEEGAAAATAAAAKAAAATLAGSRPDDHPVKANVQSKKQPQSSDAEGHSEKLTLKAKSPSKKKGQSKGQKKTKHGKAA